MKRTWKSARAGAGDADGPGHRRRHRRRHLCGHRRGVRLDGPGGRQFGTEKGLVGAYRANRSASTSSPRAYAATISGNRSRGFNLSYWRASPFVFMGSSFAVLSPARTSLHGRLFVFPAIGERTRDKIATARRKGKWSGATPPMLVLCQHLHRGFTEENPANFDLHLLCTTVYNPERCRPHLTSHASHYVPPVRCTRVRRARGRDPRLATHGRSLLCNPKIKR